jgi:amino-acid N-acetyltransferase
MCIYTFGVHNFPRVSEAPLRRPRPTGSKNVVRHATRSDVGQIWELVAQYAAQGLMLPRTVDQILSRIDNYVVAADASGRVAACAALEEYSPSLGEVSSVAVAPAHHGKGLGTQVVLGVERLARARNIEELFALSLTDDFFLALDYKPTTISRYPEKLARYEALEKEGVQIVPKRCFQKLLGQSWADLRLVDDGPAKRQRRVG